MKPENMPQDERPLTGLLREWKVESTLPPRFNEQVWRRIERDEAPAGLNAWALILNRLVQAFARPSLAVSYVTVLLLAGLAGGYLQARAGTEHAYETLSVRYVQMVDPYQSPRP